MHCNRSHPDGPKYTTAARPATTRAAAVMPGQAAMRSTRGAIPLQPPAAEHAQLQSAGCHSVLTECAKLDSFGRTAVRKHQSHHVQNCVSSRAGPQKKPSPPCRTRHSCICSGRSLGLGAHVHGDSAARLSLPMSAGCGSTIRLC